MQGKLLSIHEVNELKEGMDEVRTLKYNSFYECFSAVNSESKSIPLYNATQELHKYKLYEYMEEN